MDPQSHTHTSSNEDRFSRAAYLVLNGAEVSGLEQLEEHLVALQVKTSGVNYKNRNHVYQSEKNQIMHAHTKNLNYKILSGWSRLIVFKKTRKY